MKTLRPIGRNSQPAVETAKKEKAFMRTGSTTTRLVAAATAVYVGAFALAGVSAQQQSTAR